MGKLARATLGGSRLGTVRVGPGAAIEGEVAGISGPTDRENSIIFRDIHTSWFEPKGLS